MEVFGFPILHNVQTFIAVLVVHAALLQWLCLDGGYENVPTRDIHMTQARLLFALLHCHSLSSALGRV